LQRTLNNVPAEILPGDPRVWNVLPRQLTVASQQNVSSSALFCFYRNEPAWSDGADCLSAALQCQLCGGLFAVWAEFVAIRGVMGVCGE